MKRQVITGLGHFHYVTFACNGRRQLLKGYSAKQIVIHVLSKIESDKEVMVIGFVIMSDHVHLILGYPDNDTEHSIIMQELKRRSSRLLSKHLKEQLNSDLEHLKVTKNGNSHIRIWQPKYYDFNLISEKKLLEKLKYLHQNPVRAGLVDRAEDYKWSSAAHYEQGKNVGVKISGCL